MNNQERTKHEQTQFLVQNRFSHQTRTRTFCSVTGSFLSSSTTKGQKQKIQSLKRPRCSSPAMAHIRETGRKPSPQQEGTVFPTQSKGAIRRQPSRLRKKGASPGCTIHFLKQYYSCFQSKTLLLILVSCHFE